MRWSWLSPEGNLSQRITLPRSCGDDDDAQTAWKALCVVWSSKCRTFEFAFAALKGNMSGVHNSVLIFTNYHYESHFFFFLLPCIMYSYIDVEYYFVIFFPVFAAEVTKTQRHEMSKVHQPPSRNWEEVKKVTKACRRRGFRGAEWGGDGE